MLNLFVYVSANPLHKYDTWSILKQRTAGFNSEFSFS